MSDRRQPPIDVLGPDLLWRIFLLNANMEDDFKPSHWIDSTTTREKHPPFMSALNTTRRTAQVCRHWRELLLGWPSIWARLIDLDDRQMDRDDWWREEVRRRTGRSPLHIMGTVNFARPSTTTFFFSLIQDWERIKMMDIRFFANSPTMITLEALKFLTQESKNLQSLNITFFGIPSWARDFPLGSESSFSLTTAPSLRELSIDCHFINFDFGRHPQFFSQILVLKLVRCYSKSVQINISTLLDFLRRIPNLESLTIDDSIIPYRPRDTSFEIFRAVNLHQLREISIKEAPENAWAILEHINARAGCALHLETQEKRVLRPAAHRLLSRYMRSYFDSNSTTWLSVQLNVRSFTVAEFEPWNLSWRKFLVTIEDGSYSFNDAPAASHLSTTISECRFAHVTHLDFKVQTGVLTTIEPQFIPFLLSFISLEVLLTTVESLVFLDRAQVAHRAFPSLKTLRMADLQNDMILSSFLTQRHWNNLPVLTLDLRMLRWIRSHWEILSLAKFPPGLKVIWTDAQNQKVEYICGSS